MLKLQEKDKELTEMLEDIYFASASDPSQNSELTHRAFFNLMTHYCLYDIRKVSTIIINKLSLL